MREASWRLKYDEKNKYLDSVMNLSRKSSYGALLTSHKMTDLIEEEIHTKK